MEARQDAVRGAGWMLVAQGATRGITFAASLILARLLAPDDFGVVAVATLVLAHVGTLTGLGLPGVIVVADEDRALLRTTLTLLLIGGAVGAAALVVAAGPLAELFNSRDLEPVLVVLSLTTLVGGATFFYEAVFQRELRFRRLLTTQLARALAYTVVAIAAAAAGAGVWSLVAGQLAGIAAYAFALMAGAPYLVLPGFSLSTAAQALRHGRGFFVQALSTTLQHNLDVGAAGLDGGARAAGYYSMAWTVSGVPYNAFTHPVTAAAFPALAQTHRRAEPTSELGLDLLTVLTLFAAPAGMIISATAEPLVVTVLGSKWQPAAAALAVLGAWVAVVQIEAGLGWFLNAIGRAGTNAAISAGVTVALIPALLIGTEVGGIAGIAWAMLGSAVVASIALMVSVRAYVDLPLRRQLLAIRGPAVGCAFAWASARGIVELTAGLSNPVQLLTAVPVGFAVYLAAVRLVSPATARRGISFAAQALRELGIKRRGRD